MKFINILFLLISLVLSSASGILAQNQSTDAQNPETLRAQLRDIQTEEAALQIRAEQLDWELKPENIANYTAPMGSTRPEVLREQRRRQLQLEKDQLLARQAQLMERRVRLEAAIIVADAQAYQRSAQVPTDDWLVQTFGRDYVTNALLFGGVLMLVALFCAFGIVAFIRKRHHRAEAQPR